MERNRQTNRKKAVTSLLAGLLAFVLLLSGTFAWFYTTNEINEFDGKGTLPDKQKNSAVLHDDFDKWAEDGVHRKDVFVENTGEDSLFVRIRLDEYMEIYGESLVAGAKKDDESTWQRHTKEDTIFAEHWSWVLGGEAIEYKPNEEGKQGVVSRYDENGNDTLEGATELELTHNGKVTSVVTMAEYKKLQEEGRAFAGWITDTDGYAYWSEKLPSGGATGRLLNQVSLKDTISEESEYYYGINVVFETVDEDDLDAWLNGTETEDGSRLDEATDDAKDLLEDMSERDRTDGQTNIQKEIEETEEGNTVIIGGIEFMVLRKNETEGTAELITEDTVLKTAFSISSDATWSESDVYTWMNEKWYARLSDELKKIIEDTTKYTNPPKTDPLTVFEDKTTSKIYLLSVLEYNEYLEAYGKSLYAASENWWLRSPVEGGERTVHLVNRSTGVVADSHMNNTNGVRPTLIVRYKQFLD